MCVTHTFTNTSRRMEHGPIGRLLSFMYHFHVELGGMSGSISQVVRLEAGHVLRRFIPH